MGVRRGGQGPPLAGQNSKFFVFFLRKIVSFYMFVRQIVCFCPPWKILPSFGKKSADAHACASAGEGKRGEIVCFSTFLIKIASFKVLFRQIVCFCTHLEKLRTPLPSPICVCKIIAFSGASSTAAVLNLFLLGGPQNYRNGLHGSLNLHEDRQNL